MKNIILASQSKRRKDLLSLLIGDNFPVEIQRRLLQKGLFL